MNNVLLVGCGHMGSALLSAWRELKSYRFSVVDPYNYYKLKKKYNKKKIQFFDKLPNQSLIKSIQKSFHVFFCPYRNSTPVSIPKMHYLDRNFLVIHSI